MKKWVIVLGVSTVFLGACGTGEKGKEIEESVIKDNQKIEEPVSYQSENNHHEIYAIEGTRLLEAKRERREEIQKQLEEKEEKHVVVTDDDTGKDDVETKENEERQIASATSSTPSNNSNSSSDGNRSNTSQKPSTSNSSKNNTAPSSSQQKKEATTEKKSEPKAPKQEPKKEPKQEPKPEPKPEPSIPTGFVSSIENEINNSVSYDVHRTSKSSQYNSLVKDLASGKATVSSVRNTVSAEFTEGGFVYQPTDVQVYTFTTQSGDAGDMIRTMQSRGFPASTAYRRAAVYYNANTKTYTVGVIGLGYFKMETFD
ncbi:hypothetical protein [Bacillus alkalicellulosilyticus]|uniref:hypothetical protein n=1 Tax=Alkalihalobacterium alkalicellulosilyticum TaxID=1912214 RepID=UPI000996F4B8|nr:hypothetical protein [Bacillus alkalicellulosilyticus]